LKSTRTSPTGQTPQKHDVRTIPKGGFTSIVSINKRFNTILETENGVVIDNNEPFSMPCFPRPPLPPMFKHGLHVAFGLGSRKGAERNAANVT
jgi:hypothetical protein